jgi:hypothetical protein
MSYCINILRALKGWSSLVAVFLFLDGRLPLASPILPVLDINLYLQFLVYFQGVVVN